jgi:hypothetical protein
MYFYLLAAMRVFFVRAHPWLAWVMLAGAALFAIALPLLLLIIARRSRWDRPSARAEDESTAKR